jgi:hypothetical protein
MSCLVTGAYTIEAARDCICVEEEREVLDRIVSNS